MNDAMVFTINSGLMPIDAESALEQLKDWLKTTQQGQLDIAPLQELPQVPTQPALQLLFAAIEAISAQGDPEERLTSEAMALYTRLTARREVAVDGHSQEVVDD